MNPVPGFFDFAQERYRIHLRRQLNQPLRVEDSVPVWTEDPVLRSFRFCNVFREDDATTAWFREAVRNPLSERGPVVTFATVFFRWFNRVSTGQALLPMLLEGEWDRGWAESLLESAPKPLFTGAFMIKSPLRKPKVEGILNCVYAYVQAAQKILAERRQVESLHWALMAHVPFMGRFMAYEVVTDLRWTTVLRHAPDVNSWASAGPGAARGLQWLYRERSHAMPPAVGFNYQSETGQQFMLAAMREILEASRSAELWPAEWPAWELREVEHTLCEYDKYRRALSGERLKRRFP